MDKVKGITVSERHKQFLQREERILQVAEALLLENNQQITLDELAVELDIAKGTLYKHFKSKNELLLQLIIKNEEQILELSKQHNNNFKAHVPVYMLHHLLTPERTILLHQIEENLTMTESSLNHLFDRLYEIRQERLFVVKDVTEDYLKSLNGNISIRDYLSYIWSLTYGACLLLNSSYYQRSIGSREKMINFYISQALSLPSQNIVLDSTTLGLLNQNA